MTEEKIAKLLKNRQYFEIVEHFESIKTIKRPLIAYLILALEGTLDFEKLKSILNQIGSDNGNQSLARISEKLLSIEMVKNRYIDQANSIIQKSGNCVWRPTKIDFSKFTNLQLLDSLSVEFNPEVAHELLSRESQARNLYKSCYLTNLLIHKGYFSLSIFLSFCMIFEMQQKYTELLHMLTYVENYHWIDQSVLWRKKLNALLRSGKLSTNFLEQSRQLLPDNLFFDYSLLLAKAKSDLTHTLSILEEAEAVSYVSEQTISAKLRHNKSNAVDVIHEAEKFVNKNPEAHGIKRYIAGEYERRGAYDSAYRTIHEWKSNILKEKGINLDTYFSHSEKARIAGERALENKLCNEQKAVFIVGLPRSGTSVTEKLIFSTNNYASLGESTALHRFIDLYGYPTTTSSLEKARKFYLEANRISANTNFIDKNPANYNLISIIKSIFPNAKIIRCARDPGANAWSLYKTKFALEAHPYTSCQSSIEKIIIHERRVFEYSRNLFPDIFLFKNEELIKNESKALEELETYLEETINFQDAIDYVSHTASSGGLGKIRRKIDLSYRNYTDQWEYLQNRVHRD